MKKVILVILISIFTSPNLSAAEDDKPLTDKDLENIQPSGTRLESILDFFQDSTANNTPNDPDKAAKDFGYKSFEEFAKEYLKLMKLTDISVNEIREYLSGTDESVIIDQSQENLDKLY